MTFIQRRKSRSRPPGRGAAHAAGGGDRLLPHAFNQSPQPGALAPFTDKYTIERLL